MNIMLLTILLAILANVIYCKDDNHTYEHIKMSCYDTTNNDTVDFLSGYYSNNKWKRCNSTDLINEDFIKLLKQGDFKESFIRGCGDNSLLVFIGNSTDGSRMSFDCVDLNDDYMLFDCKWERNNICLNNGLIKTVDYNKKYKEFEYECCQIGRKIKGNNNRRNLISYSYADDQFWSNDWDGYMSRVDYYKYMSGWYSKHDNGKEDRRYRFKWVRPSGGNNLYSSSVDLDDTSYDNAWTRSCKNYNWGHSLIHGVKSSHNNHKEDRIFRWRCGHLKYHKLKDCFWTAIVNDWDRGLNYRCPSNRYNPGVLRGVYSFHNNHREDRRWKFECCKAY